MLSDKGASIRLLLRGDVIFVPAGEVHGTVNTTPKMARLISFQAPPDMALYRGEHDTPDEAPTPKHGHRSNVQVINMASSGPVFGKSVAEWRSVVSPQKGSVHLSLDYICLNNGQHFIHEPIDSEAIYVLKEGCAEVTDDSKETQTLQRHDVLFLSAGDTFSLAHTGNEPTTIITCRAVATAR